jgi:hypothetical protein
MKKILIIIPALIFFSCVISITSHSQEVFASDLSKESFASRIQELRNEYGINKTIPKEIELECLAALSYYPELKNIDITFRFGKPTSTMISQPKLNSIFRKNDEREYQVIIRKAGTSKSGLEWDELSFNSLVGWIAHELGHIVHYNHKAFGGIMILGAKYSLPKFRRRIEIFADQLVIKHGLGDALYEGTDYSINSSNAKQRYKNYLKKFYLSPSEIKRYMGIKGYFKMNYRHAKIVDINSIDKT